jgi:hypothetical protein
MTAEIYVLTDGRSFERHQYAEVHAKWSSNDSEWEGKKTASDTYGVEHLMRLLGKSTATRSFSTGTDWRLTAKFPCSLPSRAHCPDQHGPAVGQSSSRGTY